MAREPHTFCVMLQITTRHRALSDEAIDRARSSGRASEFAAVRRAVVDVLPRDLERVIAVFPVEAARAVMLLHEAVGEELGADLAIRPPPDYVPPTRE